MTRIFGETYGCFCGSVLIVGSGAPEQTERIVDEWLKLHPEGKNLHGMPHYRVTVERARELRAKRGQEVERSEIHVRPADS